MIKGNRHLCKPYTPQSVHASQGYNEARRHSTNQRITRRRSVTTPQKTIKRNDNDSNRSLAHCASSTSPKQSKGCKLIWSHPSLANRKVVATPEDTSTNAKGSIRRDRCVGKWSDLRRKVQTQVVKTRKTGTDTSGQIKEARYRHTSSK